MRHQEALNELNRTCRTQAANRQDPQVQLKAPPQGGTAQQGAQGHHQPPQHDASGRGTADASRTRTEVQTASSGDLEELKIRTSGGAADSKGASEGEDLTVNGIRGYPWDIFRSAVVDRNN